jgi:hypothetical protein
MKLAGRNRGGPSARPNPEAHWGGKMLSGLHFASLRIGKRRAWVASENTYAAAGRFSPRGPLGIASLLAQIAAGAL